MSTDSSQAFGNALGSSLADAASGVGMQQQAQAGSDDSLGDFIAKNNNWAHVDVGPMPALVDGQSFSETVAARRQASDPLGLIAASNDSASA